jgi:hypothetical protein
MMIGGEHHQVVCQHTHINKCDSNHYKHRASAPYGSIGYLDHAEGEEGGGEMEREGKRMQKNWMETWRIFQTPPLKKGRAILHEEYHFLLDMHFLSNEI